MHTHDIIHYKNTEFHQKLTKSNRKYAKPSYNSREKHEFSEKSSKSSSNNEKIDTETDRIWQIDKKFQKKNNKTN